MILLFCQMPPNSNTSHFLRIISVSQNQENHMVPQLNLRLERWIYYGFGKEASKENSENY